MGNIGNTKNDYEFWRNKTSGFTVLTGAYTAVDTNIKAGDGILSGLFISSIGTAPTVKIWDSLTATATILMDTWTPVVGPVLLPETKFNTGLTITIGKTSTVTVFYK